MRCAKDGSALLPCLCSILLVLVHVAGSLPALQLNPNVQHTVNMYIYSPVLATKMSVDNFFTVRNCFLFPTAILYLGFGLMVVLLIV